MALALGEQLSFRSPTNGNNTGRLLGLRESSQALAELKTKLEFALSRLNDQDTQRTGVEEIREFLQALYPEWFPMVISCISEAGSNLKPLGRCESVKLLGLLAELHGDLVVPLLQRILQVVVTRLQDADLHLREACAETVFRLARALVEDTEGSSVFATLLKPLFGALAEHNKWVQIGAAACICSVIQGSPPLVIRENLGRLCSRLVQHLSLPLAMAKPQLLSACIYAMQAVEGADFDEVLPALMPCLEACLQASSDWQTRKQAIEVLQVIGDNPELGLSLELPLPTSTSSRPTPLQRRIAVALESVKADKVRAVREAAKECLLQWSITRSSGLIGSMVGPRSASPLPTALELRALPQPQQQPQQQPHQDPPAKAGAARPMSPGPASGVGQWPQAGDAPIQGATASRGHSRGMRSAARERADVCPDDGMVAASARAEPPMTLGTPLRTGDYEEDDPASRKAARDSAVRAALLGADLNSTKKPRPKRERVSIFNGPANSKFFNPKAAPQVGLAADECADGLAEERALSPRADSEEQEGVREDEQAEERSILSRRGGQLGTAESASVESESVEDWRESCDDNVPVPAAKVRGEAAWPDGGIESPEPEEAAEQPQGPQGGRSPRLGGRSPMAQPWGRRTAAAAAVGRQGDRRPTAQRERPKPQAALFAESEEDAQRGSPVRRVPSRREQASPQVESQSLGEGSDAGEPQRVGQPVRSTTPSEAGREAEQPVQRKAPQSASELSNAADQPLMQRKGSHPGPTSDFGSAREASALQKRKGGKEVHGKQPSGLEAVAASPPRGSGPNAAARRQDSARQPQDSARTPPPAWPWEGEPVGGAPKQEPLATAKFEAATPAGRSQAAEDMDIVLNQLEALAERLQVVEEEKQRMEASFVSKLERAIQACEGQSEALIAQREQAAAQERRLQAQEQQLKVQEQRLQKQERQLQQQGQQLEELQTMLQQQEQQYEQQFEQQDQQLREQEQQLEQHELQLEEHKAALEELVDVGQAEPEEMLQLEPSQVVQRRGSNDSRGSGGLCRQSSDVQSVDTGISSSGGGLAGSSGDRPNLGLGNSGLLLEALGVKNGSPKKAGLLWDRVTELCSEQRFLEAYKQAIAEPEESCLLRLMRHTGPIVERLDAESNSRLIRRLIHILSSPSKDCAVASIEQIFAWLRQAIVSGIHFTASQVEDLAVALQRVAVPQSPLPPPARAEAQQLLLQVSALRQRGN